jgi:hypothetical protein
MIYGTHSWDEGGTHISCEEDPITHKMVLIEKLLSGMVRKLKLMVLIVNALHKSIKIN